MPTLYSRAYMQPEALLPDSRRLRVRLLALADNERWLSSELAALIRRELGAEVPFVWDSYNWDGWLKDCPLRDLLDFVTLAICTRQQDRRPPIIARVNAIFAQESVAYEVAEDGSVRPKVDLEFAAAVRSALAGLTNARYRAVRAEFELGQAALTPINPNWSSATYHTFRANEALFRLVDPAQPRLVAGRVEQVYGPLVQAVYSGTPQLAREATAALNGYKDWIDAAHFERHAPGSEEPHDMPQSLGALMVSQGASYLRWLLDLDARVNGGPTPEGESHLSA
ncbi:MAG: hypothetical protein K0S00_3267 [Xanthobacteraceae bacterium]|jgi:hypothetical protein|nr:hypothetical protein [Xanthobacteraceae bacterium]